MVAGAGREDLARRGGVPEAYVSRLVDLGLLPAPAGDAGSPGDVRRVRLLRAMEEGGLPIEGIAAAVRAGDLSFDFLDSKAWDWYGGFVGKTYAQVAAAAGMDVDLLRSVRGAMGFVTPEPDDLVHEEYLAFLPVLQVMLEIGVDVGAMERLLRVWGDGARRITEASRDFYHAQIEVPLLRSGMGVGRMMETANLAVAEGIPFLDQALVALYHAHSEHSWLGNVVESVEAILEQSGLHHTASRPPAMSFLDLSGYTRLTEERGDEAAAEMAATLGGLVQQSAARHGGRPVKWLGDGVMMYFADPGGAVASALELAERVPGAGLPQIHAGIDAGPVVMQDGDYFGRTVNTAARIAAHAGPGEVLVSERVEGACRERSVGFADVGSVELKGLAAPVRLFRATPVRART